MIKKALAVVALAASAVAVTQATAIAASPVASVVYSANPSTLPGNVDSVGFEATSVSEFGDEINIGAVDSVSAVTVTMSSFACEVGSWSTRDCYSATNAKSTVPITLNVYGASSDAGDGTVRPGELLLRVTKKFNIPYRPSASPKCAKIGQPGKWYNKTDSTCYNGRASQITYNLSSLAVDLPSDVVVGIAYNTTHYGAHPIGQSASCFGTPAGCFYDALNVGTNDDVTHGSQPDKGTVFQNTVSAGSLCDGTPALGVFNLDSPTSACWTGYVPAITVTAVPSAG